MPGMVLRAVCVALAAGLPLVLGMPAALVLLFLIPVAVECCREGGETVTCAVATAALGAVCCWLLPFPLFIPALIWCAAGVAMCFCRRGHSIRRGIAWAGICAALLCAVLFWLGQRYQGQIFAGLAETVTDWIANRKDSASILLQCYQSGLSRLEDDMTPVLNLFGMLLMTEDVKLQLLYSLRATLEAAFRAALPQGIVAWVMVTAVLSAAVPDAVRRRKGLHGRLNSFGEWQLNDTVRRHLNVLALMYLVQLLTDSPVLSIMGSMCIAAFQYAYMILGLAVTEGLTKRLGTAKIMRRLWMAAFLLFAPFMLVLLGIADRIFDLRGFVRSMEE